MITHLYDHHGIISAVDIMKNKRKMDTPYDPSTDIESYFEQIEDAVEFAAAGSSPFPTTQIVTKAFIQMFSTGLYKDEYKAWNRLPNVSRDWVTFKLILTAEAREIREMQTLSGNTGYVNSVQQDIMDQTALVLTNLANSTAEDRVTISNVATANNILTQQLARTTEALALMQTRLNTIETQLGINADNDNGGNINGGNGNGGKGNGRNGNGGNGNGRNGNGGNGNGGHECVPRKNNRNNESYCFSHARTRRDGHTSGTCNNPVNGHITTATLNNRQGGSTRYCGNAGE